MTGREKILIITAVGITLIGIVVSVVPKEQLPQLGSWPDKATAANRLAKAGSLLRSANSVNARYQNSLSLRQALTVTEHPNELPTAIIERLTQIATAANARLTELKPGLTKQEGKLLCLPVNVRAKAAPARILGLMANFRNQLPMVRITRVNLVAGDGMLDAGLTLEFLTDAGKTGDRGMIAKKRQPPLTGKERRNYLEYIRNRLQQTDPLALNWSRLGAAFYAADSSGGYEPVADGGFEIAAEPKLLGVVTLQGRFQALIGLGSESWYFTEGQSQAGITVLKIAQTQVTVRYQGKMVRLNPQSGFWISPVKG